jgi:hypothetical protein
VQYLCFIAFLPVSILKHRAPAIEFLDKVKKYGYLLAIAPFLMGSTVTVPKLYLELVASGAFGNRTILEAQVLGKYRTPAFLHEPERCHFKILVANTVQTESLDCGDWDSIHTGDRLERLDAWTVYMSPDESTTQAAFDIFIFLITVCMIAFLLRIRSFIEWVEKQVTQSAPIISPRKDNV